MADLSSAVLSHWSVRVSCACTNLASMRLASAKFRPFLRSINVSMSVLAASGPRI